MTTDRIRVGVVSLGCDKNRVDTENMIGFLCRDFEVVNDYADADVVIINTCAFIESAVKESIDVIMEAASHDVKLIVTGCLPMRYPQIAKDGLLPEVSAFLDNHHYTTIAETIYNILEGGREVRVNTEVMPVAPTLPISSLSVSTHTVVWRGSSVSSSAISAG